MAAEKLLSSKTKAQIEAEAKALQGAVATTNLSERPLNNVTTNPNYAADLARQQARAQENRNLAAAADSLPGSTPEYQAAVGKLFDARTQSVLSTRPDLQTLAANKGIDMRVPAIADEWRNRQKEQEYIKKLGGSPRTAEEYDLMMKAVYSPSTLQANNWTPTAALPEGAQAMATGGTGQAGQIAAYNPDELRKAGFNEEQIKSLMATGGAANAAQQELNATPKPTNAQLGVLQQALKAKSGVGNQAIGTSQLYEQAGITTKGAGGYAALAQSLSQRRAEMGQTYDSYANLVQTVGGQMNDTYRNALDNYQATMKTYETQVAKIEEVNKEARAYEKQLDLMKRQAELSRETWLFQTEYEAEIAARQPKIQWQAETENQPAGFINLTTGEFTPISVGGNSYGSSGSAGSYLGDGVVGDNSGYSYSEPVPHGTANVAVVQKNPNLIDIYKNGYQKAAGPNGMGGQCAYEAQQWVDFNGKGWKVGNTIQEKAASFANYAKQGLGFYKGQGVPQVGYAVFSNDDPKWGHYWVINSITDDGKLVASEFNRAGNRVFSNNRIVDPNDKSIIGFLKTTPKGQYQVKAEELAAKNINKAKEGIKNIAQGKVQGGLLDLALAGAGVAKSYLTDTGKRVQEAEAASAQAAAQQAKIDEGIKAGILDANGAPYPPERVAIRSGAYSDTMLNQKYKELQTAVKKGYEPQAALDAFNQDIMAGRQKLKEIEAAQTLQTRYSQPMTETQSNKVGFAVSAMQAEGFMPTNTSNKSLGEVNSWVTRFNSENQILNDEVGKIKDPVARQIAQSELQWVGNVLRGESGAAITVSEYKEAGRTYFPRPGDSADDLARKKKAREQKVHNLLLASGPQGAIYWQNLGYELPSSIAKQYNMETPKQDNLGLFGGSDPLKLGL